MGANPLDDDEFWDDLEDVIMVCVKKDKTVNLKTSIMDMEELRSVLTTAYLMAIFHDTKSYPKDIDKLQ